MRHAFLLLLFSLSPLACAREKANEGTPSAPGTAALAAPQASAVVPPATPAPSAVAAASSAEFHGDAERGKNLVQEHQCNRCHEGTGLAAPARDQNCVGCHQDILKGTFPGPPDKIAEWRGTVRAHRRAPSLSSMGGRLRPDWLASFLHEPTDLRPLLSATMPRLGLSEADSRDIAAYLTRDATGRTADHVSLGGEIEAGGKLFEQKGCGSCHAFTGTSTTTRPNEKRAATDDGVLLAPDLRFVRERFRSEKLVTWLVDPKSQKSDTLMPNHGLDANAARDLATYILETPLAKHEPNPVPARLAKLERRVTYLEVEEKVLSVTCRHCHADPDALMGEGGPGNTGGFGFKPRHLDLASYQGISSGYLDDQGERVSVFAARPDGTPRLIAALVARQAEEAGSPVPGVRGMPLGLPALSPEQIQLVESWVAQGRPR
jgi:cytochrome c2